MGDNTSGFSKEMQAALKADGEKLLAETCEDHGPFFVSYDAMMGSFLRTVGLDRMTPEEIEDYLASK